MLLVILIFLGLYLKEHKSKNEQIALNEAISDTLHKTRNDKGELTAKIEQLQSSNISTFLDLQSKDSTISKLQKIVKNNQSRLGDHGSVSTLEVNTTGNFIAKTDSIISKDSIKVGEITYIYPEYKSHIIKDKWISAFVVANRDSTTFIPMIHNEFNIILGEEAAKKGILHTFDRKIPFGEVTSLSPYSDVKSFRTYQVNKLSPKHWGIGLSGGYGINKVSNQVNIGWYIGAGVNYNLFTF